MQTITEYLDQEAAKQGMSPEFRKKIKGMMHKSLDAPKLEKAMQQIAPYAEDNEVIAFLTQVLGGYPVIPDISAPPLTFQADFSGYARCLRILVQSQTSEAKDFLLDLARYLVKEGPGHLLEWLDTIVGKRPDFKHLDELRNLLDDYYDSITLYLKAHEWFQEAGIEWPKKRNWRISIRFSTDGEIIPPQRWLYSESGQLIGSENALSEEEKEKRLTVVLEMFAPVAHVVDSRLNTSFSIKAFNDTNMHGTWDELTHYFHGTDTRGEHFNIRTQLFTPVMLSQLLDMLEKHFNVCFVREPCFIQAGKGIKKASVEKWAKEHCARVEQHSRPARKQYDEQTERMINNAIFDIGKNIAFPLTVPIDKNVTKELDYCTQNIETYCKEHSEEYTARNADVNAEDTITLKWLGMVDILLKNKAVCELDYKCEFEDFKSQMQEIMKGKKACARLYDALENGTFDKDGDITDWCEQVGEMCKPHLIGYIDIDSDSYVLFPTQLILLENSFKFSAARIGKRIDQVK